MKQIKIANLDLYIQVDDEDYERINSFVWHGNKHIPSTISRTYFIRDEHNVRHTKHVSIGNEVLQMYEVIIDHKDRNLLNNQRHNLRKSDWTNNAGNRTKRKGCSSQYRGVSRRKNNWEASIKRRGKSFNLGNYNTEIEAALAYNKAASEYYGEFANLNVICWEQSQN